MNNWFGKFEIIMMIFACFLIMLGGGLMGYGISMLIIHFFHLR